MTFAWNTFPFPSVPAQGKTSYAIQMEHYTYEGVLYILSPYVWIIIMEVTMEGSVYKIHVRATEK